MNYKNVFIMTTLSLASILNVQANVLQADWEVEGTYKCTNVKAYSDSSESVQLNTESSYSKLVVTSTDEGELNIQMGDEVTVDAINTYSEFVSDDLIKLSSFEVANFTDEKHLTRDMTIKLFPLLVSKKEEAPEYQSRALIEITNVGSSTKEELKANSYKSQLLCIREN